MKNNMEEKDNICLVELKRIFRGQSYTIGHLYIDGKYVCDTLEDQDRNLDNSMSLEKIKELKIQCHTAIPTGTYVISMDIVSPKYGKKYPRLLNVKGFEGILLHSGNDENDSCGCVLCGINDIKGKVTHSRETFKKVYDILQEARNNNKSIVITIE